MDQPSELSHQFGISVLVVYALEAMKRSNWQIFKWIGPESTNILRLLSMLAAAATSAGFKIVSGDWQNGMTVMIPPMAVLLDTAVHTLAQWGAQTGYYRLAVDNDGIVKQIVEALKPPPKG